MRLLGSQWFFGHPNYLAPHSRWDFLTGIFDCPSVRQFATVLMELFFFRPSANTCHGRGDGEGFLKASIELI